MGRQRATACWSSCSSSRVHPAIPRTAIEPLSRNLVVNNTSAGRVSNRSSPVGTLCGSRTETERSLRVPGDHSRGGWERSIPSSRRWQPTARSTSSDLSCLTSRPEIQARRTKSSCCAPLSTRLLCIAHVGMCSCFRNLLAEACSPAFPVCRQLFGFGRGHPVWARTTRRTQLR